MIEPRDQRSQGICLACRNIRYFVRHTSSAGQQCKRWSLTSERYAALGQTLGVAILPRRSTQTKREPLNPFHAVNVVHLHEMKTATMAQPIVAVMKSGAPSRI